VEAIREGRGKSHGRSPASRRRDPRMVAGPGRSCACAHAILPRAAGRAADARETRVETALLRNIPMFASLSAEDLSALGALLEVRRFAAQQPIVFFGDRGTELFVVRSGHVIVSYPDDSGHEVSLVEMGSGGFFGEISIFDGGPRTANVRS